MVDVTRTFPVAAAPGAVAAYLRDFANTEQWDPGTVSCSRVGDGPIGVGAHWRNVSSFLGRETELDYELTRDEPGHIVFVGRNKTATSTDDITLVADPDGGGTTITYHAHIEFNGAAALAAPIAKVVLERAGTKTEENLRRILGQETT